MSQQPIAIAIAIVGWREWIGLPQFGISKLQAKVDTGAKTSALHVYYVTPFEQHGQPWVRFGLHPAQEDGLACIECSAPIKDVRRVTDSGGHSEERYVIETSLRLLGEDIPVEVTLTDRTGMRFRMLLGRSALKGRFLVDCGRSFLLGGNRHQPPVPGL